MENLHNIIFNFIFSLKKIHAINVGHGQWNMTV